MFKATKRILTVAAVIAAADAPSAAHAGVSLNPSPEASQSHWPELPRNRSSRTRPVLRRECCC
jgi:hypothetical protein